MTRRNRKARPPMASPRTTASTTANANPPPRRSRLIAAAALVVIAVVGALAIARSFAPSGERTAGGEAAAAIGGPFTLTDHLGQRVSDADFRGRYMLVYFGYMYCPDICPTSLTRNAEALAMLGDKAASVVPILITVDPERDTPDNLKEYVPLFDARLIGLTGTADEIKAVAKAYRVYYAKVGPQGSDPTDYLVDHSGFSYLMGPDGRLVQFFRHDLGAAEMAERLRKIL